MLVDLARNDIGRVCQYGSIELPDYMVIERYSHVMHIVSQVIGTLDKDKTAYDLMRATFPGRNPQRSTQSSSTADHFRTRTVNVASTEVHSDISASI